MKKETKGTLKKVGAVIASAAIIGLSAFAGANLVEPTVVTKEIIVPVNNTITKTVTIEVPTTVEVIKEVDNGKLDTVLNYLEDNFGDDNLVFEDVRDIVANIESEDAYKAKAKASFKSDFKDYIVAATGYKLSDARLVTLRDAEVTAYDYEDKEYRVTFEAEIKFSDDDSSITEYFNITYEYFLDRDDAEDVEVSIVNV